MRSVRHRTNEGFKFIYLIASPAVPAANNVTHVGIDPKANRLLAALPEGEWQRWHRQLERVEMPLGQVLYESGTTLSHTGCQMPLVR